MISTHQVKMSARWFTGGVVVALMTATAFASQGLVQDRRVSMKEAQQMAAKVPSGSEFQVVVNDLVLTQLNRTIGTPEGREFMRESLKRMETYRQLVTLNIQKYGLPAELMAIPIVESGYQNLEQDKNPGHGAGIWMFIKSTARMFGLKVEGNVDERLNPELETVAAMKYLKAENQHFGDWSLAVLSYNMGQRLVEKAIKKTGSRDAWVIVRKGFENDPDYLPKLMAAILIMNNPESVE